MNELKVNLYLPRNRFFSYFVGEFKLLYTTSPIRASSGTDYLFLTGIEHKDKRVLQYVVSRKDF